MNKKLDTNLYSLRLLELVAGIGNQLRYVDRFATCRRNHKENVAEHQFYTAFFTLVIGQHLAQTYPPEQFNLGLAVMRALVHDVEEHYTGDVIRPVKHGDTELSQAFDKMGNEFTRSFFQTLTYDMRAADEMYKFWAKAKDESLEGRLVKFADYLSVLAYLDQEVRSGNRLVMDNVDQLMRYSEKFNAPEFRFLQPLQITAYQMVDWLRKHNSKEIV